MGFTGAGSAKKRKLKILVGFPKKFGGVPGLKRDPARGPPGPFVGFIVGFFVGFRRTPCWASFQPRNSANPARWTPT